MALRETAALSRDGGAAFYSRKTLPGRFSLIPSKITDESGDVLHVPAPGSALIGKISQAGG